MPAESTQTPATQTAPISNTPQQTQVQAVPAQMQTPQSAQPQPQQGHVHTAAGQTGMTPEPAKLDSASPIQSAQQDAMPEYEQQYNDIMAQAAAQGFNEHSQQSSYSSDNSEAQHTVHNDAPTGQLYAQKQGQAQSAIAKILQNRQISGAGKLLGGNDTPKKLESSNRDTQGQLPPANIDGNINHDMPTSRARVDQSQAISNSNHQPAVTNVPRSEPPSRPKKVEITERFKKDESKLAPELLEQLSPQPAKEDVQEHVIEMPIPENFTSPISSLKFAYEKDDWANLIEKMALSGRVRQFALHAMYEKQGGVCVLQAEQSQQHLDSPMLRDKLQQSFSLALNEPVELRMEFIDKVQATPFLIQQEIDQQRYLEAVDAVNSDPIIQTMVAEFDAVVNEKSVKAL